MRNFDTESQFNEIKKATQDAVQSIFPVEGKQRVVELNSVSIRDNLDQSNYSDQAKTKARNGTWGVPVYASLTLKDKSSGEVLDRSDNTRLFLLPKITDRFSHIVKGNEWQVSNQLRLKPGAYSSRKKGGDLKTQVNLSKGKNFEIQFDEKTNKFLITKIAGGQANIPLYPLLIHLGISPSLIARTLGDDVASANKASPTPQYLERVKSAFGVRQGDIKDALDETEIDPETTKTTLGERFKKVDGKMLLKAAKKLLDIHKGKDKTDDKESLEFKETWSSEDFIKDKLEKNKKALASKIRRGLNNKNKNKLSQIVNPGSFNQTVESFFTQSDKSSTPEQINPLEMLSGAYKTTIMGEGGIQSEQQVPQEARDVHPSHYGFLDPIHTPESQKIGANLHFPLGTVKDGKEIKSVVKDKEGNKVTIDPKKAFNSKIKIPDKKKEKKEGKVKYLHKGEIKEGDPSEIDYETPAPQALFSWSSNLIPFLPSNQGNRAMMAAKQMEQGISLKNREEPLVQVEAPGGGSIEKAIGKELSKTAPFDGEVTKVEPDHVMIKGKDGEKQKVNLYNKFSLNRKSFMDHQPLVKPGDKVKKNQQIAESNFTKNGALALGSNPRTAYLPWKGRNFEDGIVISESASEKFKSQHITKKSYESDENSIQNLNKFKAHYPNLLTPQNLKKLDKDGVIKKGETVEMGEAVIAALKKQQPSQEIGKVKKTLSQRPKDDSVYWNFEDTGKVVDIQRQGKTTIVHIETEEKAKIGDKIAGRMGNKGVITDIIRDEDAPKNKDGEHAEVLLNPHGVISRSNVGQIYESAVGKAAKKQGKPISVPNFDGEDNLKRTKEILNQAGVDDKEELFDPETGKSIGKVHVGNPHLLKLFKTSTSNYSVRQGGPGHPYDLNKQPLKAGGQESAKNLDILGMYSLLSHGARNNLREMSSIKSNQNDEFWKALKSGQPLPPPEEPFVYDKFKNFVKGAGIDLKKNGSKLTLAPMMDKQIEDQSSGEVKKTAFYNAKNFEPKKDGFFDKKKFGGLKGTRWGHINLEEPQVNPVFENAVKKISGLGNRYDEIVSGKVHYKDGKFNKNGEGVTGGKAIKEILSKIDVDKELDKQIKKAEKAKGNSLDDANKKIRHLSALKEYNLRPEEAYVREKVPVLPPQHRPIYPLPDGNVASSDINFLYQNMGLLNDMAKQPVMDYLPEDEKQELRQETYKSLKGVTGLTDINIQGRPRKGTISEIKGGEKGQPKKGFFIDKVLSKKQDYAGRGTIIPEPDLGVDEVGLPDQMAKKLFEPFVTRELTTKFGKTPTEAKDEIKKDTKLANKALDTIMRERKVILNRAPSLHKFSMMSFKPQRTSGSSIKIPPLVTEGFNADFDGDAMTVHTPITDSANQEADKMLPSKNLYKPGSGKLMLFPSQEAQVGLFYLSKSKEGRQKINKILPSKYSVNEVLDKKSTKDLLQKMSKDLTNDEFSRIVNELKSEGEKRAYSKGFTLGVDDLKVFEKERDKIVNYAKNKAKENKNDQKALKEINKEVSDKTDELITKKLKNTDNPLYDMVDAGARGNESQLRGILSSPMFLDDSKGNVIPDPIEKSYSEGLDTADYWKSTYGARRGMMDRALQTSIPGAFSKDIMATTIDNVVSDSDCGTKDGVMMSIDDPDLHGRFVAGDQKNVSHNEKIDNETIKRLKKSGLKEVKVRSPLTCKKSKGVCQKCYGIDELGDVPNVGDNVGAKAGQTMSEPLVQMAMNTFHTGGASGTGVSAEGYERIDQLLKMPKQVPGEAPLAQNDGEVTKIEKGTAGGKNVYINDEKHFVPAGRKLKVSEGKKIKRGDPLSEGAIKPQDLAKHKGMRDAQNYIVDELKRSYESQGQKLDRKTFETVVRSTTNQTKVMNNPKSAPVVPGDSIPFTEAEAHNNNLLDEVSIDDAEGLQLADNYGPLKKGKEIKAPDDINLLKGLGNEKVKVEKDPIVHEPNLTTIKQMPLMKKDWMSAMGYENLAKALTEGAGQSWSTDLEGYHPFPAFAQGKNFGKGKEGKY